MTNAICRFRRQRNKAIIRITNISITKRIKTEQAIPCELTLTDVLNIVYINQGSGRLL